MFHTNLDLTSSIALLGGVWFACLLIAIGLMSAHTRGAGRAEKEIPRDEWGVASQAVYFLATRYMVGMPMAMIVILIGGHLRLNS